MKVRGAVDIVCYMHSLPPHQFRALRTFNVTLYDSEHSGDAIDSCVYLWLCSESAVGSCWLGLPFGGFRCLYMFWSTSACLNSYSAYSVSVSQDFLRFTSLRGVFP